MAMANGAGDDVAYTSSYDNIEVHELMLRDEARTGAYAKFIADNQNLFMDKIVVDVGAGTGILSLFAAMAGARQVFAIESSDVAGLCAELVARNNLAHRVTVLRTRVEDVHQLPGGVKADVLISEWMGFYLLHESMLASVIVARDRLLSPAGMIVPAVASVYVCPVSMKAYHERNVTQWTRFYGFDFTPVSRAVREARMSQPLVAAVPPAECLAPPHLVARLELAFVGADDIRRVIAAPAFVSARHDVLRGFAVWFDVEFEGAAPLLLSTAPDQPDTHWHQTVLMLPDALLVSAGDEIRCNLMLSQDEANPRRYNITVEVPDEGEESGEEEGMGEVAEDSMAVDREEQMDGGGNQGNAELEGIIRQVMTKER